MELIKNKRIQSNIFFLFILQGGNYLLPLITMPYLVRVLGPEHFGLLAFATATIGYFGLITDYGFNLSATRQVSIYRDDPSKLSEIYSSVVIIKIIFFLLSSVMLVGLMLIFEKFNLYWELYLITFGTIIGYMLFPVWLFQGLEQMKYITFISITGKSLSTVAIFLFIRHSADYLLVPLFSALGNLVSGLWSLYIVKKKFNLSITLQPWIKIKHQIIEGWNVFFTSVTVSLYTLSSTFILGIFSSNTVVGYFSGAEKIINAVKGLYVPISQAIYPHMGRIFNDDNKSGIKLVHRTALIMGTVMLALSMSLFLFADSAVKLVLGNKYLESVYLVKIMAFLPFIVTISNIFAVLGLYGAGKFKTVTNFIGLSALLHTIVILILAKYYEAMGVSIMLVITEMLIAILSIYYFNTYRRKCNA